ncbi:trypsin-like serine protease [Pontibacterium sp. N1Y112]|uniref:Trypsin-like serine protease n=1 Tax=Pontibacterium sinense TaxID=2781979 RepID=A0A8J7F9R7_9GAMM|nr:trypsin-like serine protease [Pontibacterium sinense]
MDQSILNAVVAIEYVSGSSIIRGSGVLLPGGTHILTAAHLFNQNPAAQSLSISSGNVSLPSAKKINIHHGWDKNSSDFNHDIAVIELASPVVSVDGVQLWTQSNVIGEEITFAGFGGDSGFHTGTNTIDADGSQLNATFNRNVVSGTQLVYDHDNGTESQNTLGGLINMGSARVTTSEGQARAGDSGGPLLLDGKVVGISSYAYRDDRYDVNSSVDFSAGEVGFATAVHPYIPWIESITQGNPVYSEPTNSGEVLTSINEPFTGEVTNYFLLELAAASSADISFHYRTQNGTAIAGEDYQFAEGDKVLKAGETSLTIPIQILGDVIKEENETFSVVVNNFVSEGNDMNIELIATHTILDNDILS